MSRSMRRRDFLIAAGAAGTACLAAPSVRAFAGVQAAAPDPDFHVYFTIQRSWKKSPARHPFEYDCMENPRQEDFENAYYVRERYRPVCMRVEGEGMALSKMVCRRS
jgi:hypothetical protein